MNSTSGSAAAAAAAATARPPTSPTSSYWFDLAVVATTLWSLEGVRSNTFSSRPPAWFEQILRRIIAAMIVCVGITRVNCADLWHGKIQQRWQFFVQFVHRVVLPYQEDLIGFATPGLLLNISILSKIFHNYLVPDLDDAVLTVQPQGLPHPFEVQRFMKFATAAYGIEATIGAAVATEQECTILQQQEDSSCSSETTTTTTHHVVAQHCGIEAQHILAFEETKPAELHDKTQYLLAVDHDSRSVVLAIRGTFDTTTYGAYWAGYTAEFCGGVAHTGFSRIARHVWNIVRADVTHQLGVLPNDYQLLITGHSVGAGVAMLINILVHYENSIHTRNVVRCMAYAPIPSFYYDKETADTTASALYTAVHNTSAYVNHTDPLCAATIYQVRIMGRHTGTISAELSLTDRVLVGLAIKSVPQSLISQLENKHIEYMEYSRIHDGTNLLIPANCIVHMERVHQPTQQRHQHATVTCKDNDSRRSDSYTLRYMRPEEFANRGCLIDHQMYFNLLSEHTTTAYEVAVQSMCNAASWKH